MVRIPSVSSKRVLTYVHTLLMHHIAQAWHAWAKAHTHLADRALLQKRKQQGGHDDNAEAEACIVQALQGFFRTIALGMSSSSSGNGRSVAAVVLQDTLRLLTLWFSHGGRPAVHAAVEEGEGWSE